MANIVNFLYISVFLCAVLTVYGEKPEVETTHGKISGKKLKTLYKEMECIGFMGIPYAQPPVKELRFMPPQPIKPWEGVLMTTKEKKACAQFNNNVKKNPMGFYGSEDCLYLDIFTPATDDAKRNVIVFLFNEHFVNSYNKTKDYQHDFFIEEDVIMVTISHRLTALGFLNLDDELLWGNSGMKDIVAGLEWVRDNIEKFGGDPEKITLMGVQGGAAAVDLLMHSKKRHLFKSAIMQSGNAWSTTYLQEDTRERAFKLANLFDKHPTTSQGVIDELQQIPARNITTKDLHAMPDDYFKETQRSVTPFSPIVEKNPDGLIVDHPENSKEINTPVLIGFNSREGLEASLHYLVEPRYMSFLYKDFPLLLPMRANFSFDPFKESFMDPIEEIKDFYFYKGIRISRVRDFVNYIGDVLNSYAIDYTTRHYSKISTAPVYYYHFDFSGELNENKINILKMSTAEEQVSVGAAQGDELCYLFKCPDLEDTYLKHKDENTPERQTQKKLIKLWTNFAKFGNPTPEEDSELEGLKWPPYNIEDKQYLHISDVIEIKSDLNKRKFEFWDQFYEKWGKKAVNGVVSYEHIIKDELYLLFYLLL